MKLAKKRTDIIVARDARIAAALKAKKAAGDLIAQNVQLNPRRGRRSGDEYGNRKGDGAAALARDTGMDRMKAQRLVKIGNEVPEAARVLVQNAPKVSTTTYQYYRKPMKTGRFRTARMAT